MFPHGDSGSSSFSLSSPSPSPPPPLSPHHLAGSPSEAVWVEGVEVQDPYGGLDAEVVELTGDLEEQQVVLINTHTKQFFISRTDSGLSKTGLWSVHPTDHGQVLQHQSVHPSFVELVLVLGQPDVVQPTCSRSSSRINPSVSGAANPREQIGAHL